LSDPSRRPAYAAWFSALVLLLLAAGALFWPQEPARRGDGYLLVLDPAADAHRREVYTLLASYLGQQARLDLQLLVVGDRDGFESGLAEALVILTADGPGLALPTAAWQPLAAGRRRVPWNLRPAAVQLSRVRAAGADAPWHAVPGRTAFGDSLSLVCLAPLCAGQQISPLPAGVAWGRDPFDHGDVLAAAAFGAFDHVVVRQWDAQAALADGRLDPAEWQLKTLSEPLPDVLLLASRRLPRAVRIDLQQSLTVLGREPDGVTAEHRRLATGLALVGLDGFNLLLGPDLDRLRRQLGPCWPRSND
jgi:hypothetical protein